LQAGVFDEAVDSTRLALDTLLVIIAVCICALAWMFFHFDEELRSRKKKTWWRFW
jgi:hypothetical protein